MYSQYFTVLYSLIQTDLSVLESMYFIQTDDSSHNFNFIKLKTKMAKSNREDARTHNWKRSKPPKVNATKKSTAKCNYYAFFFIASRNVTVHIIGLKRLKKSEKKKELRNKKYRRFELKFHLWIFNRALSASGNVLRMPSLCRRFFLSFSVFAIARINVS